MFKSLLYAINNWRAKQNSQRNFLIYCSVLVGLVGGFAAVALKYMVHLMEEVSRHIITAFCFCRP
jgi:CIC family chloride channel protein